MFEMVASNYNISFLLDSLEELRKQESYLQYALDRLNLLNDSQSNKKVLSISTIAKKMLELWMEMPFKNFVPLDKKVDGHDYKYYERQYDEFYNNL